MWPRKSGSCFCCPDVRKRNCCQLPQLSCSTRQVTGRQKNSYLLKSRCPIPWWRKIQYLLPPFVFRIWRAWARDVENGKRLKRQRQKRKRRREQKRGGRGKRKSKQKKILEVQNKARQSQESRSNIYIVSSWENKLQLAFIFFSFSYIGKGHNFKPISQLFLKQNCCECNPGVSSNLKEPCVNTIPRLLGAWNSSVSGNSERKGLFNFLFSLWLSCPTTSFHPYQLDLCPCHLQTSTSLFSILRHPRDWTQFLFLHFSQYLFQMSTCEMTGFHNALRLSPFFTWGYNHRPLPSIFTDVLDPLHLLCKGI